MVSIILIIMVSFIKVSYWLVVISLVFLILAGIVSVTHFWGLFLSVRV